MISSWDNRKPSFFTRVHNFNTLVCDPPFTQTTAIPVDPHWSQRNLKFSLFLLLFFNWYCCWFLPSKITDTVQEHRGVSDRNKYSFLSNHLLLRLQKADLRRAWWAYFLKIKQTGHKEMVWENRDVWKTWRNVHFTNVNYKLRDEEQMRVRTLFPSSRRISGDKIRKCDTKADVPFLHFPALLGVHSEDASSVWAMDAIQQRVAEGSATTCR